MGFLPPLRRVLPALPRARQTLLFSATLSDGGRTALCRVHARSAARRRLERGCRGTDGHASSASGRPRSEARVASARPDAGTGGPRRWSSAGPSATQIASATISSRRGLKVAVIHGNKGQGARSRSLADFKAGRVTVLVATDIAARGLDIAQLPLVVNFDLPLVAEDYIHRVGRTGRAGLAGRAISLVTASDAQLLREIQRLLPATLEQVVVEGFDTPAAPTHAGQRRNDHQPARRGRYQTASTHSRPRQSRHHVR